MVFIPRHLVPLAFPYLSLGLNIARPSDFGAQDRNAEGTGEIALRQSSTKITINLATKYQTIDGFGTSEAFQRANTIVNLKADKQRYALDLLFNTTNGAGLTILRNGIGSSPDSSSDHMNTILPKNPGGPDKKPTYVWDGRDSGQLFVAKEAVKYGVRTFYADAWSAPGFMKSTGNEANGGTLCGVGGTKCSSGDWTKAYADYLIQYVKFYAQEGVNITHLGFLNEPELSTTYASMQSSGSQAADFIKVLYPALQGANLSIPIPGIACCDAEGWSDQKSMTSALSGVSNMLSLITGHGYTSQPTSVLTTAHHVWQTEWADLQGAWTANWYSNGGAGEGLTWANHIYDGLTAANCSGYLYWIGAQGGDTNSKMIKITNGDVIPSKRLWAFAGFSRVLRPGSVRVGTSGGGKVIAAKNVDGTIGVTVINGASAGTVSLSVDGEGFVAKSAQAWKVDQATEMVGIDATVAADGTVSASAGARAMVSFLISGSAS